MSQHLTDPTQYPSSQQQFAARLRHAVAHGRARRSLLRRPHRPVGEHRSFAERLRTSLEHR